MKLFEPGNIGVMRVKNRVVMAPMGVGAMAKASSSQKGGRGRRLLCGGFASTNRRMTMNKNIAVERGHR